MAAGGGLTGGDGANALAVPAGGTTGVPTVAAPDCATLDGRGASPCVLASPPLGTGIAETGTGLDTAAPAAVSIPVSFPPAVIDAPVREPL